MIRFLFVSILTLLIGSGCALFQKPEEKPADELIQEGLTDFDKGNYSNAIEAFEQLKDWYPFSKYAILAELKIADAYFNLEDYPEAVFAYEEFEQLHPRNEAVPYVIYRIGLCHFNRIDTIDRDQTPAQEALVNFERLLKEYPEDPYSVAARGHIQKCYKSLAGHDLLIGVFYYKGKHYKAALERFKTIVTSYPDVGYHHKALMYIVNCEALIAEEELSVRAP
jgi:outer membrane protein assembly factor BamD